MSKNNFNLTEDVKWSQDIDNFEKTDLTNNPDI